MPRKTIYFKGFTANAGSSILNVNLEHGFRFERLTQQEGVSLVSALERWSSPFDVLKKLSMDFPCLDNEEQSFHCISNSFEANVELDDRGGLISFPPEYGEFNRAANHGYVIPTLRLMRLFKEGGICMPLWYYFFADESTPKPFTSQYHARALHSHVKYNLDDAEISDLEHFIQSKIYLLKNPFWN